MDDAVPIADVATGAFLARTVESATGLDRSGHTTERNCLNCGTMLAGDYCHACGQKGHVHRSLGAFGHDLLHGVFHFEGKVWHTLPMLAWRPGELTRRYIAGERARFVSPIALFLFAVFLMFAVAGTSVGMKIDDGLGGDRAKVTAALTRAEKKVFTLEFKDRTGLTAAERRDIDRRLAQARAELQQVQRVAQGGVGVHVDKGPSVRLFRTGNASLDTVVARAESNPALLFYKLKSNAYKFSWALIPLSLPLLWLLFLNRRGFRMYDHTVFVTYSLAFMTLLVVAGSLWRAVGLPGAWLLALLPPVHIYRQLRTAYALPALSALWRAAVLTLGALIIALLFGFGLILLGLF